MDGGSDLSAKAVDFSKHKGVPVRQPGGGVRSFL
jgi:hypothetical protein